MRIKKFLLIFFVLTLTFLLTGCTTFDSVSTKTQTIVVNNDEFETDFEVKIGKQANIGTLYKNGYYLLGYYDQTTEGTLYFDAFGQSSSMWQENFPTVFLS
jgi:hypothetical protein